MGFVTGWSWYWWNWWQSFHVLAILDMCWLLGGWGLAWDGDKGYLMTACQEFVGPTNVKFPLEYMSVFEDPENQDPDPKDAGDGGENNN